MKPLVLGICLIFSFCHGGSPAHANDSIWHGASSKYDIPPLVLYALALQESRRIRPDGTVRPWPWTFRVNKEGHPSDGAHYFDSYTEAADELVKLIDAGVVNIDIGMMQVNWKYNGDLLPNPRKILQPNNNVELAAYIFRRKLDRENGDLTNAIARYHSPQEERGRRYANSVITIIRNLQSLPGLELALTL